jgi:hypothetical protein
VCGSRQIPYVKISGGKACYSEPDPFTLFCGGTASKYYHKALICRESAGSTEAKARSSFMVQRIEIPVKPDRFFDTAEAAKLSDSNTLK